MTEEKKRGRPRKTTDVNLEDQLSDVNVEIMDDKLVEEDDMQTHTPVPTDPDWTPYVLTLLRPEEFNKKYPTVNGIRRVTEILLGKIIRSESNVVQCPAEGNSGRATVVHYLEIQEFGPSGIVLRVNGAVDVFPGNAKAPFHLHIVSSADTKAEGKALRRALKLNIVLAEEITDLSDEKTALGDDKINSSQTTFIDNLCMRNKISVKKVVTKYYSVSNIAKLSYEQASELCGKLGEYQRAHDTITEDIKGYDSNWRNEF